MKKRHQETVDILYRLTPIIHPQDVLDNARAGERWIVRVNGWLADHIVAFVGTMICAYLFAALALISLPHAIQSHDSIIIVAWIAQTFIQLVLLPVIIVAQNRQTERDRVKDEVDHKATRHLYEVNEEQLQLLRKIAGDKNG